MQDESNKSDSLPSNAKRVFQGEIFEVWQWEQKMFDGSTQTFERLKRGNSAQVIAAVGDKIIIQDQEQPHRAPFISLPGGRCDGDEDPLAAAQRELKEETGYASQEWQLLRAVSPVNSTVWTIYTFTARNCRRVTEPHFDVGEKIENRLISFDELLMLPDNPKFRNRELVEVLLRARYEPHAREELRRAIFG